MRLLNKIFNKKKSLCCNFVMPRKVGYHTSKLKYADLMKAVESYGSEETSEGCIGGFTTMKPPTKIDYERFKYININDMWPSSKIKPIPKIDHHFGKNVDQMVIEQDIIFSSGLENNKYSKDAIAAMVHACNMMEDHEKRKDKNIKKKPLFDTSNVTDMHSMFSGCPNMNELKAYIEGDMNTMDEYIKIQKNLVIKKEEETKMTKKQRIKQLENNVHNLNNEIRNLYGRNRNLQDQLLNTQEELSCLLEMISIPTVVTDSSRYIRWVDHANGKIRKSYTMDLVERRYQFFNYNAEILHDSKYYFVFKIVGYVCPDDTQSLPDRVEYYKVNKTDSTSEKIDIKDYMEMVKKF